MEKRNPEEANAVQGVPAKAVAILGALLLACSCLFVGGTLSACSGSSEQEEMATVLPSSIKGLKKKIVAKSYRDALIAQVTVSPAYGRTVRLERYDPPSSAWTVEQEYETWDIESAQLQIDFGNGWKNRAASKFRIVADSVQGAGPANETLGSTEVSTKIVNKIVNCKTAIVVDAQTGEVAYSLNPTKKLPIASMTKMMSAILLVENRALEDPVKITQEVWETEYSFGFSRGDTLTADQALHGMMVASANDAAAAVAYEVGGSIEGFADMMNARAKELGCNDTVYKNPHGLDEAGAHSTAADVARIGCHIMNDESCARIREAATADVYKFAVERTKTVKIKKGKNKGKTKEKKIVHGYELYSTNEMLGGKDDARGIKTGFTDGAGACFCGAFDIDGHAYVTVVMGADVGGKRWTETRKLVKFVKYARANWLPTYGL